MRAIVQRAADATVRVNGVALGQFSGLGLVVLVGVTQTDTDQHARRIAEKVHHLRIFDQPTRIRFGCVDSDSARELAAADLGAPIMVISQFTLYADTRKGRRPTWEAAAPKHIAEPLVGEVIATLRKLGSQVSTGEFGAEMDLTFTNVGPLTVSLEVP